MYKLDSYLPETKWIAHLHRHLKSLNFSLNKTLSPLNVFMFLSCLLFCIQLLKFIECELYPLNCQHTLCVLNPNAENQAFLWKDGAEEYFKLFKVVLIGSRAIHNWQASLRANPTDTDVSEFSKVIIFIWMLLH